MKKGQFCGGSNIKSAVFDVIVSEITRDNDIRKSIGRGIVLGLVSLLVVVVLRYLLKMIFPNYVLNLLNSISIDLSMFGLITLIIGFIPSALTEEFLVRYIPFKFMGKWRFIEQLCFLVILDVGLHMFNIQSASFSGYVYYGLLQTFGGFMLAYSFLKYGVLGSFVCHYVYNATIPMVWCIKLFLEGW